MASFLLVGKGSFGDMFPLFAIANRLKLQGNRVAIATQQHHFHAVASMDIEAIPIDSNVSTPPQIAVRSIHGPLKITDLYRTLAPISLQQEYDAVAYAAQHHDVVIGNQLAYAGAYAAKKLQKHWVYCAASPLAMPSWNDPPLFPYLHALQRTVGANKRAQHTLIMLARLASMLLMRRQIKLQKQLGIYDGNHPRFEGLYSKHLNIVAVSKSLIKQPTDWPPRTLVTGFNWFDPTFLRNDAELARVNQFVQSAEAPIVIAPSGMQRVRPHNFFKVCIEACKLLRRRAIVVAATRLHHAIEASPDILVCSYLPYSDILPKAAAIIHCGGIGTIGWCLKFQVPSLIVPFEWDQFDNADRALQRNYAAVIQRKDFNTRNVATALAALLQDSLVKNALLLASQIVATEDGTSTAVSAIERLIDDNDV